MRPGLRWRAAACAAAVLWTGWNAAGAQDEAGIDEEELSRVVQGVVEKLGVVPKTCKERYNGWELRGDVGGEPEQWDQWLLYWEVDGSNADGDAFRRDHDYHQRIVQGEFERDRAQGKTGLEAAPFGDIACEGVGAAYWHRRTRTGCRALLLCGGLYLHVDWLRYPSRAAVQALDAVAASQGRKAWEAAIAAAHDESIRAGSAALIDFVQKLHRVLREKKACGCAEAPAAAPPPPAACPTEWVWILSVYEDRLQALASAVTEKYRRTLNIPPGRTVTVSEWLDEGGNIIVGGEIAERKDRPSPEPARPSVIFPDERMAAARAEFGARKKALDEAFAKSFDQWTQVCTRRDARAVAALWEAFESLKALARAKGSSWAPGAIVYARGQIASEAAAAGAKVILGQAVETLKAGAPKVGASGVTRWLGRIVAEQAAEKGEDWIKEQLKTRLEALLTRPAAKTLDELAEMLPVAADKRLFDAAYKKEPDLEAGMWAVGPDGRSGAIRDSYYALNGPAGRSVGYHTGMGLRFSGEDVLLKKAESMRWEIVEDGDAVAVSPYGASELQEAFEKGKELSCQVPHRTRPGLLVEFSNRTFRETGNYVALKTQYTEFRAGIEAEAEAGEKAWFAAIQAGSGAKPSPDDALQTLGAVRLLRADLQKYVDENPARQWKKWGIEKLASRIAGLGFLAVLGPLKDAMEGQVKSCIAAGVEALAPDRVRQLIEQVDRDTPRIARLLARPDVPPVLPERDRDLDRLLALNAKMPFAAEPPKALKRAAVAPPDAARSVDLMREAARLAAADKIDEAISSLQAAVEADPKQAEGWMNLADLLVQRTRWAEAEAACRGWIESGGVGSGDIAYAEMAMALLNQDKREEAVGAAREAQRRGVRGHPVFDLLGLPED